MLRNLFTYVLTRAMHVAFIFTRGMTLGVRAACFDEQGRVFLVRHTYIPGWHLPGGGIERNETALQALAKEIREEGNLKATSKSQFFHVYLNKGASRRDHVFLYQLNVMQTGPRKPDYEIAESGFFHLEDLPEGTTNATRRRLDELAGKVPPDDYW
jgi:ADP-ribose pyrophosphatase YjhB (NUDIX family)